MADRDRAGQYYQQQRGQVGETVKGILPEKAPSASQALTVATLFPLGGLLLVLSGLALAASVVGLAVATPVFLIFSPVRVPAALLIGLAVAGFLTSGALGLGGLSSLTFLANTARQAFQRTPDYVEQARRRMAEAAAHAGHKTAQAGHAIQGRADPAGTGAGAGGGAGATTSASARAARASGSRRVRAGFSLLGFASLRSSLAPDRPSLECVPNVTVPTCRVILKSNVVPAAAYYCY